MESSLRVVPPTNSKEKSVWEALVSEVKQCGKRKDLQGGKHLHMNAIEVGCHRNRYVAHTLISMYGKCGSMQDARDVFESMVEHDVVSWNALILGYVENGESSVALQVFVNMECKPNRATFLAVLKACACSLEKGMAVHRQARERGFHKDILVASTLVDMYAKCGSMLLARHVFDSMMHRNVVSWNSLLLGYVENGECLVALEMFSNMDCAPDSVTFVAALKACAQFCCVEKGMAIHRQATECGLEEDVFLTNTLVDMYSKFRDMACARYFFDKVKNQTVVSWTALILGYVENGECSMALNMFASMDCAPNHVTLLAALKACKQEMCVERGMAIHRQANEVGLDKHLLVANALMEMYGVCGTMRDAHYVFDNMIQRDVVSWNSLMLGYVENREYLVALKLFTSMSFVPDVVTFVVVLKACANLGALEIGQRVHKRIRELGLEKTELVATSLVDLYGKCGDMCAAEEVFNKMHSRDVVAWTALVGGYSSLGDASQVFGVVKRMQEAGLAMDGVTLQLILTACSHTGMVEEAQEYFAKYGITTTVEHYTCMVDILGRANRLQEALALVRRSSAANSTLWMSLLGACTKWKNVEVGSIAFSALVSHDKDEEHVSAAYVLMGDLYRSMAM